MKHFILLCFLVGCGSDTTSETPVTIDEPDSGVSDVGTLGDDGLAEFNACPETLESVQPWGVAEQTELTQALEQRLDEVRVEYDIPTLAWAVAFHDTRTIWSNVSGGDTDGMFRVGSVTKTMTAAAIHILVEKGVVSFDDPLEKWVPGYFDGLGVKIEHLITNTSGIVSYNYVGSFDDTRAWTPEQLVQWAVDNESELRFVPGSQWEYSNTNYILMGMVIEAATESSYENYLSDCFLGPLELSDSYLAGTGDANPRLVGSYDTDGNEVIVDPSFGWSAGSLTSTPPELAAWGASLFGGEVLSDASLTLMTTALDVTDPDQGYGYGAFVEVDGTEAIYGHTGGIGGFLTYMYSYPNQNATLVIMSNRLPTDLRDVAGEAWLVLVNR